MNRQRVENIASTYGCEISVDSKTKELVLYTQSSDVETAEMISAHFPKYGLTISMLPDRNEYIVYTNVFEPDMRLCKVWVNYADGGEISGHEVYLDIDSSVEDQIRRNFEPAGFDTPQIVDFKWDLVQHA